MSISAVTASPPAPIKMPQASETKPPEVKHTEADGTRLPQPTVLAALPPGQGTRVNRLV